MAERDAKGRFTKEYAGGPGRPSKKREERFLEITLSACTYDDWAAIVKKAVFLAKRGDATSRKWLSDYLIGPPQQRVDVTTKDESLNAGRLTDTERLALLAALIDGAEDGPTGQDTQE